MDKQTDSNQQVNFSERRLFEKLINREAKMAVLGLGYLGWTLAQEFSKYFQVLAYDDSWPRLKEVAKKEDELPIGTDKYSKRDLQVITHEKALEHVSCYIIALPPSVDKYGYPEYLPIQQMTEKVARVLTKGDWVIFQTQGYPGFVEEKCLPILQSFSNLKVNEDFYLGYAINRVEKGHAKYSLNYQAQVVAAGDEQSAEELADLYEMLTSKKVHKAPSIKVAEAARLAENVQHQVNVALINELGKVFNEFGIRLSDVLKTSESNQKFTPYEPMLVGGFDLGTDPYIILEKMNEIGLIDSLIDKSRAINEKEFLRWFDMLNSHTKIRGMNLSNCRVLMMGVATEADCANVEDSSYGLFAKMIAKNAKEVTVLDPLASASEVSRHLDLTLEEKPSGTYDLMVIGTPHEDYKLMRENQLIDYVNEQTLIVDFGGLLEGLICHIDYVSI